MEKLRKTDIKWNKPEDYYVKPFFPADTKYHALILLEKEEAYDIVPIWGINGSIEGLDSAVENVLFPKYKWALLDFEIIDNKS